MSIDIQGLQPERFARVGDTFASHFEQGLEGGAGFALCVDGELVLDLYGGFADRARTRPFAADTLVPVFSTTKAVTALMVAAALDEGRLDYDQRVCELWPDFAAAGKGGLTVAEVLSHQSGLAGFPEAMEPGEWFEWDRVCARLAAMTPLWPPGTASGYHPITFGYLAGEIHRRATGRTVGQALREDWAGPLGLDLHIGLADAEHGRVAEMQRPSAMPELGELTPVRRAAFLTRWSSPSAHDLPAWRRAEIPSANGHATAPALARLMAVLACDGEIGGRRRLSSETVAEAGRERIAGDDLVLPYRISWAAGFMRSADLGIYGPGARAFGHSGWGGSCVFADPDRRVSGAYVMTRQSHHLLGDPRARALIDAAFACL